MKKVGRSLFPALVLAALASAQSPYPTISNMFWGPKTLFAGHSNWYMFIPKWAVPVTCNPSTDQCTATSYTFKGGENAYLYSSGKPPTGLYGFFGGMQAYYKICDLSGSSFHLRAPTCSGSIQTFTDSGTGPQYVLVDLARDIYIKSVVGLPAGTTLSWYVIDSPGIISALPTVDGLPYDRGGWYQLALNIQLPSTAPTGAYQVAITVAQDAVGTNATTLGTVVNVIPAPAAPSGAPTYAPAIPGLSQWRTEMTSTYFGGAEWCSNPTSPTEVFSFGMEGQVWYYDGARVYFQIADYTGNALWRNCGHNIASQYANYVIGANGQIPGYRVFPHGLAKAALLYPAETKFKQALDLLRNSGVYTIKGGKIDDDRLRETAYAVDTYAVAEGMLGEPRHPLMQRSAEFLMGMLLSYTDYTGRYSQYQTFYCGLAMEALIDYYQVTKDTRVPYVVKRMLDDIWAKYDQVNHVIMYDPDPQGRHCANFGLWFTDGGGDCAKHAGQILHHLVDPAFAWYWKISGDDTYRERGDELFLHGLDDGPWSGKQFSQAYRWSFYYVQTRTSPSTSKVF